MNKIKPFKSAPYKKPIGLSSILKAVKIPMNGVLHIGAHYGQEVKEYDSVSIPIIVLVEPLAKPFGELSRRFLSRKDITLINCAVGNKEETVSLYTETRNGGQSSSILKPKLHRDIFPKIVFNGIEKVYQRKIDNMSIDRRINVFNIDVQGYELEVLKGARKFLSGIDYLICEVNKLEMYENCVLVEQLDKFLKVFGFYRFQTTWIKECYGEAVYIKKRI